MTSLHRIQTFAAISIAILALKYIAYVLTGSVALLSDAIESIVSKNQRGMNCLLKILQPWWGCRHEQSHFPHAASRPDHDENNRNCTIRRRFPILWRSIKQIAAIHAQRCSGGVIMFCPDGLRRAACQGERKSDL